MRECREELAVEVSVGRLLDCVHISKEDGRMLEIRFYETCLCKGVPQALVHTEIQYVLQDEILKCSFCRADRIFNERAILGKEFSEL